MGNGEFDVIRRYFTPFGRITRSDVIVSIGDDCAVTQHLQNQYVATTTDTMVENTHFLPSISASDLAYKAIATNLSDLAAMGANPAWFSLALTLPKIDQRWLSEFSNSLFSVLDQYNVELIGGDTTKGSLYVVTITAQGIICGQALCRHSANVGDSIYVSGTLGDSAGGLRLLLQNTPEIEKNVVNLTKEYLIQRHLRPTPRISLGKALAKNHLASAAIDISDGLVADLGHILQRSQCRAVINLDKLPLSQQLVDTFGQGQAECLALSGGEDYELCFTVSEQNQMKLEDTLESLGVPYCRIGQILAPDPKESNLIFQRHGQPVELGEIKGFDHFK
ncbi:thiamine-phosphate kinase [Rodentibacter caecimuris]|uniref:Thiamine-monophosphate kinase n=1 Tax=Rodentibacter caecimuris TaxID=1796644 RepID=A0ABX3KXH6_9PAST|nr:thiamine-phosphate kinase [Rodentibacter heylii]